ncbi:hypothetical protein MOTT27_00601 [Mycobacterium intracellulare subsp. yongonense]|nr:hypothetical protein MOTT27_00601 [Mycobacterium intracellulare subsp. yongonense]
MDVQLGTLFQPFVYVNSNVALQTTFFFFVPMELKTDVCRVVELFFVRLDIRPIPG